MIKIISARVKVRFFHPHFQAPHHHTRTKRLHHYVLLRTFDTLLRLTGWNYIFLPLPPAPSRCLNFSLFFPYFCDLVLAEGCSVVYCWNSTQHNATLLLLLLIASFTTRSTMVLDEPFFFLLFFFFHFYPFPPLFPNCRVWIKFATIYSAVEL